MRVAWPWWVTDGGHAVWFWTVEADECIDAIDKIVSQFPEPTPGEVLSGHQVLPSSVLHARAPSRQLEEMVQNHHALLARGDVEEAQQLFNPFLMADLLDELKPAADLPHGEVVLFIRWSPPDLPRVRLLVGETGARPVPLALFLKLIASEVSP